MEGINNLGGTCAINSLIQIISRNEIIRSIILNANVPNDTFTAELKEIIDLLYIQKKSLNPVKFINYFYKTFKGIFNKYEEIDINELWFYIYEKINEETSTSIDKSLFNIPLLNIHDEHNYKIANHNSFKESELSKNIQGSIINIIQCCHCNNKTYSFEPFISITLDIQPNNNIAELIGNYMKDEYREKDDWKCEKCNKNQNYIKTCRIWKLPKILFICLNRFKDINNKNNTEVFINDDIIFNNEQENKYKLQAIGIHNGGINGGHYTALCNINDGNYHLFNDNEIIKYKEEDIKNKINSSNAYLIVYEKLL